MKRVTVFAEGSHYTDPKRDRTAFDDLWKLLLAKCGVVDRRCVRVIGFSKDQLVAVRPPPKFQSCRNLALDMEIKRAYDREAFDVLVIAFDLIPKHNALMAACRRQEVEQLLLGLCDRANLPPPLLKAAEALLAHYRTCWAKKQQTGSKGKETFEPRPPQALELLVMEPMFEALLLADERGFRNAIGLRRAPRGWRSFDLKGIKKPDQEIILPAFSLAPKNIRILVDSNDKHQIAELVLRKLPEDSAAWRHEIVARLRRLVNRTGRPLPV